MSIRHNRKHKPKVLNSFLAENKEKIVDSEIIFICKCKGQTRIFLRIQYTQNALRYSTCLQVNVLKVTPDLRGCPQGKNSYVRHFKGKHGKLCIIRKLNGFRFRKKKEIASFFNSAKENHKQLTTKMTICHSIELIGYQIQAHWQNNCTVLTTKDQSTKVCQQFSIFWLVIF